MPAVIPRELLRLLPLPMQPLPRLAARAIARSLLVPALFVVGAWCVLVVRPKGMALCGFPPTLLAVVLLGEPLFDWWELAVQYRARRVIRAVANPAPSGWRGPLLVDLRKGEACVWFADGLDADEAEGAVVRACTLRMSSGRPSLVASVVTRDRRALPAPLQQAVLRRLRPVRWWPVTKDDDPSQTPVAFYCYLDCEDAPVIRDATWRAPRLRDDERDAFTRHRFEVPEPIAFPREPFAEVLERHRAIVRAHLDALTFQCRTPADGLDAFFGMRSSAATIALWRDQVRVADVFERAFVARQYESIFAVRRRMQARRDDDDSLDVVVRSDDAVSLHVARLETRHGPRGTMERRLVLDETTPPIVEPARQEQAHHDGKTIVYWQATAGGAVRRAVTTAPERARSVGEIVDRLLELRLDDARRAQWELSRLGAGYVLIFNNRLGGEAVIPAAHRVAGWLGILDDFPRVARAVARHRRYRDWFPVVVDGVRYAGVRWLPMRADVDPATRPENVDEVKQGAHLRVVDAR
jgi:hypothetical protein